MEITIEKRAVSRTGRLSQWFLGYGYCTEVVSVKAERWCVLKDGKVLAECRSKKAAEEIESAFSWAGHTG